MDDITYESLRTDAEILALIERASHNLNEMGFTEHSLAHAAKCASTAELILSRLGKSPDSIRLARVTAPLGEPRGFHGVSMVFFLLHGCLAS